MFKILIFLLATIILWSVILAAPTQDVSATGSLQSDESSESATPLPPVNVSNQTLKEQSALVGDCWKDARIGHGPSSADPWVYAEDNPPPRKTDPEECAKITTYYDKCHCFISVMHHNGKNLIMKYFVYAGSYESVVTYKVTEENGL